VRGRPQIQDIHKKLTEKNRYSRTMHSRNHSYHYQETIC